MECVAIDLNPGQSTENKPGQKTNHKPTENLSKPTENRVNNPLGHYQIVRWAKNGRKLTNHNSTN